MPEGTANTPVEVVEVLDDSSGNLAPQPQERLEQGTPTRSVEVLNEPTDVKPATSEEEDKVAKMAEELETFRKEKADRLAKEEADRKQALLDTAKQAADRASTNPEVSFNGKTPAQIRAEIRALEAIGDDAAMDKADDLRLGLANARQDAGTKARKAASEAAQAALEAILPEAKTIADDPDFAKWAAASPRRSAALSSMKSSYDVDGIADMMSTFQEIKQARSGGQQGASASSGPSGEPTQATEADPAAEAALADAIATAGSSDAAPAATKKRFSSSELIRLASTNPGKYESMQAEIMQAYVEGRVDPV